jgi:hypothetical protein
MQEPSDDRCWAYREFYGGCMNISLYLLENDHIEVCIFHTFGEKYCTQLFMLIEHPNTIPTYDLINIIFDRITEDFKICLVNCTYIDVINCSEWLIKHHPEVCNFDIQKKENACEWMELTRENCQYLQPQNPPLWTADRDNNDIIYGNIDASGVFKMVMKDPIQYSV